MAKKAAKKTANKKSARTSARATGARRTTAAAVLPAGVSARLGARSEFRIYPSIGVARVGDCTDSFIIGPEAPGVAPTGPFRGSDKRLKPQAARFRIYKVEIDAQENETVTKEVVPSSQIKVTWSVSLANRKAAGSQIIDTLERKPAPGRRNKNLDRKKLVIAADGSVTGTNTAGPVLAGGIEFAAPGTSGPAVGDIKLAALRTDDKGRLLVVGGPGTSDSPVNAPCDSFADNDGWYDSVSDGPVSATLRIDGQDHPVVPAWVLISVPRFAPNNYGIVTWFDQALSMARTDADGRFNSPRTTSFTRDIYPILRRADDLSGLHGTAHANGTIRPLSDAARIASFSDQLRRQRVQRRLTKLGDDASTPEAVPDTTMPRLNSGANPHPGGPTFTFLSLTRYQLAHIDNWVNGNFDMDWPGSPPTPVPFDQIPVARQALALCEAALEACVGGSFYPGIEGTYDIARATTYHPQSNLRREFRVDPSHPAGFLTEKMALPWQADFADCGDFWWPSQRPDDIVTEGGEEERWDRGIRGTMQNAHLSMVERWSLLGIVTRDAAGKFVERERELRDPPVA
jgi:L-Lysine epsilon oxidase N-terminal/L-lysine epsilon oxidase C-terminal domain